jgi:lysophospholipase L1-like esterase
MWNTLADDFPGMNLVNRGVNGGRLAELAEFAPVIAASLAPQLVVVSAGTNDLAAGKRRAHAEPLYKPRADLGPGVMRGKEGGQG